MKKKTARRAISVAKLKGAVASAAAMAYTRNLNVARGNGAAEYAARNFARTCAANAARMEFEAAFTNHNVVWDQDTPAQGQDEYGMTSAEHAADNTCLKCEFLDNASSHRKYCYCVKKSQDRSTDDARCAEFKEYRVPVFSRTDISEDTALGIAALRLKQVAADATVAAAYFKQAQKNKSQNALRDAHKLVKKIIEWTKDLDVE